MASYCWRVSKTSAPTKLETGLAYSAVGLIGVSIATMLVNLILAWFRVDEKPAILAQFVLIGLPLGFLMIICLLVLVVRRRSRENAA